MRNTPVPAPLLLNTVRVAPLEIKGKLHKSCLAQMMLNDFPIFLECPIATLGGFGSQASIAEGPCRNRRKPHKSTSPAV